MKGRTVLVIAHRLSTVRNASQVRRLYACAGFHLGGGAGGGGHLPPL